MESGGDGPVGTKDGRGEIVRRASHATASRATAIATRSCMFAEMRCACFSLRSTSVARLGTEKGIVVLVRSEYKA
jgi:hypothetical protein